MLENINYYSAEYPEINELVLVVFNLNCIKEGFFKGKLIENHKGSNRIIYIVNEGSQSSMTFSISAKKDFMKISSFLNQPTSFKAKITKVMNGTIGSIEDIEEIKLRYPNPLIDTATGITKLSLFQCK